MKSLDGRTTSILHEVKKLTPESTCSTSSSVQRERTCTTAGVPAATNIRIRNDRVKAKRSWADVVDDNSHQGRSQPETASASETKHRAPTKTSRTVIEPLQSDDEDDLWTLVSKAKPSGRKAVLYVGNLEENTNEDQVQEYVRRRSMKAGITQPKLHNCKVYRREEGELGNWAARITVDEAPAEYLCNRNFWCGRVYARPWIFREEARARLPSNPDPQSA